MVKLLYQTHSSNPTEQLHRMPSGPCLTEHDNGSSAAQWVEQTTDTGRVSGSTSIRDRQGKHRQCLGGLKHAHFYITKQDIFNSLSFVLLLKSKGFVRTSQIYANIHPASDWLPTNLQLPLLNNNLVHFEQNTHIYLRIIKKMSSCLLLTSLPAHQAGIQLR